MFVEKDKYKVSYGSGTIDRIANRLHITLSALTRWQHFSAWHEVMAAILKVWHHSRNPDSINRCIFTLRMFLPNLIPDLIWNVGVLRTFEDGQPNKMSSNMGSVPDSIYKQDTNKTGRRRQQVASWRRPCVGWFADNVIQTPAEAHQCHCRRHPRHSAE